VSTTISLSKRSGADDGSRDDLPLDHDLAQPIVVDASALESCHPMFAIRLRLFFDWHLAAGHELQLLTPEDPARTQQLANLGVAAGRPQHLAGALPDARASSEALLGAARGSRTRSRRSRVDTVRLGSLRFVDGPDEQEVDMALT
jgi:hypothetical protein